MPNQNKEEIKEIFKEHTKAYFHDRPNDAIVNEDTLIEAFTNWHQSELNRKLEEIKEKVKFLKRAIYRIPSKKVSSLQLLLTSKDNQQLADKIVNFINVHYLPEVVLPFIKEETQDIRNQIQDLKTLLNNTNEDEINNG